MTFFISKMGVHTFFCFILLNSTLGICSVDHIVYTDIDKGPGSLREALIDAKEGDRITFDANLDGATLMLESPLPIIDKNLTLLAPSPQGIRLEGSNQFQILRFDSHKVRMQNIHLVHGYTEGNNDGDPFFGGMCVAPDTHVILEDSLFEGNTTLNKDPCHESGAAIVVREGGKLSLINSHFANNGIIDEAGVERQQDIFLMEDSLLNLYVGETDKLETLTLAGAGTLHKEGTGSFVLNQETCQRFKGPIVIAEGTVDLEHETACAIEVAPEGVLRGYGKVGSVTNKGIVKPVGGLSGLLMIQGNYEQRARGTIKIVVSSGGQNSCLVVKGDVFLEGKLEIIAKEGLYEKGQSFAVIKSTGLIRGGLKLINKEGLRLALKISNDLVVVEVLETHMVARRQ